MFKHILIPVDGSPMAQKAAEMAVGLAKAFGSDVTLIYVIDPFPFTGLGSDFGYGQAEYLSAAAAEADVATHAAQQVLRAAGVRAETSVINAHSTWRGILDTAAKVGADLIVMGSHGRHGLEKLVLGSVTQRVLSHAHMSIFVVRD